MRQLFTARMRPGPSDRGPSETVLEFAAPLFASMDVAESIEEAHEIMAVATQVWNAVTAEKCGKPDAVRRLRRTVEAGAPALLPVIELLIQRKRTRFPEHRWTIIDFVFRPGHAGGPVLDVRIAPGAQAPVALDSPRSRSRSPSARPARRSASRRRAQATRLAPRFPEPHPRAPSPSAERPRPAERNADSIVPRLDGPLAPASAPVAVPAPVAAPPAPATPLLVTVTAPSRPALVQLLAGATSTEHALVHALAGHALAAAETFSELVSLKSLVGVEQHAYQTETVRRVLRVFRGRALLADEVGLGKTVEALMTVREYQLRGMARRILVLTPAALVAQWAGEFECKAGITTRTTDAPLCRQNPDAFWSDSSPGITIASLPLARTSRHAPLVASRPWDLVIVDEAHRVKNRATAGWKLVNTLTSRFLLLLTATPVENDLDELYSLVTLIKPGHFATPAAFRQEFVDSKDPTSPRNRARLRQVLAEVMVRNTRAQCGLRLPPRYVTTVTVDPGQAERDLYDQTVALLRTHAAEASSRLAASTLLLEAGSSPAALRATLDVMRDSARHGDALVADLAVLSGAARAVTTTRKADALIEVARAQPDQLLVFTRFRRTLEFLRGVMEAAGFSPLEFHGGMSGPEKAAQLERFRAGGRIMVATDAGAEGHNLQFCHVLVNFDLPWNPMVIEQRIGRLHRFGQVEPVQVINLCARGTIEERVLDVLDRRVRLFELVVGEMDMVLGNMADEQDLEQRILSLCAAARNDRDLDAGFDALADELLRARGVYEKTRALDEALFGKDFEA